MTFILELTVAIYLALMLFSISLVIIFPWLGNKLMSAHEDASAKPVLRR